MSPMTPPPMIVSRFPRRSATRPLPPTEGAPRYRSGPGVLTAETYVLAGHLRNQARRGNADALDFQPERQRRQPVVDVAERADQVRRDAARGDQRDVEVVGTGPGHPPHRGAAGHD